VQQYCGVLNFVHAVKHSTSLPFFITCSSFGHLKECNGVVHAAAPQFLSVPLGFLGAIVIGKLYPSTKLMS